MVAPVLLDHRGSPIVRSRSFAPQRQVRARYDAAQTTDENTRHWANADYLGPNSELNPNVRRTLRARARYECANNSYAAGMLRTLANDLVGTGPSLQITAADIPTSVAEEAEEIFWEYCLSISLPHKLRLMRQAKARDGESFGILATNPRPRSEISLDLQVIEADLVSSPSLAADINTLTDGVIVDDFGNVIGYTVLREHPGEPINFGVGLEYETLAAASVIHLSHQERPEQYRGVPEVTPSLPLFAQLRRYTLAVIRCAESAALPSWIIQSKINPTELLESEPFDTVETERGMGMTLPAGWEMNQLRAEQPTSTYPQFKREILSEIARCLGIPYNVAAGDSSSYNYSSGRLDHRTYYKAMRVERAGFERTCLDVLLRAWWSEAVQIPGYLPSGLSRLRVPPRHTWRWDGEEHVDPTKEADAAGTRLKLGLTSFGDEVARLGADVTVIHQKNAAALGMSLADYRKLVAQSVYGSLPVQAAAQPASAPVDTADDEEPSLDEE